jgi:hypothetical protein
MDLHNDFRKNFIIVSLYGNHCHHVCPEGYVHFSSWSPKTLYKNETGASQLFGSQQQNPQLPFLLKQGWHLPAAARD